MVRGELLEEGGDGRGRVDEGEQEVVRRGGQYGHEAEAGVARAGLEHVVPHGREGLRATQATILFLLMRRSIWMSKDAYGEDVGWAEGRVDQYELVILGSRFGEDGHCAVGQIAQAASYVCECVPC